MKHTWKKILTTGTLAAALSAVLVMPASAAPATDWSSYIQQLLNNNNDQTTSKPEASPQPASNANTGTTAPKLAADKSQFTAQVIALVNKERSKAGLKPVTNHTNLSKMALEKAKDMNKNNYFSHTSPTYGSPFDMMKKFGISYSYAGENIAMGQQTPEEVMKDWMNSPGHRENIMNPNYTLIGAGYYNGYWSQEFVGK
ncbi:CAP domain-containing protein [Paenibacillus sp. P96]|uniref:CAP domain-containing protein n=1 Tax=Paenibacillus zeirhizosphaerae TaxID=2987519 RepID=A0ABT9FPA7_9BACL|nr:CAP domain-containing protein [Paenibacillus sp. P96]MDP4096565.1 CAP domain-containing protein [Paenibacillus sp. P96]